MLRKMYLVTPEYLNKGNQRSSPSSSPPVPKLLSKAASSKLRNTNKKRVKRQHPYDRWFEMRNEMREADVNRKALLQMIADFVQKILPRTNTTTPRITPALSDKSTSPLKQTVTPPPRSLDPDAHEIIYETPTS